MVLRTAFGWADARTINCSMGYVDAMGPTPRTVQANTAGARIVFDYAEGLSIQGAQSCVSCCQQEDAFQLEVTSAGAPAAGRRLVNATATVVSGDTIAFVPRETLEAGSSITAVRYALLDIPQCVIYNSAGLPANPFVLPVDKAQQNGGPNQAQGEDVGAAPATALKLPPMVRLGFGKGTRLVHPIP